MIALRIWLCSSKSLLYDLTYHVRQCRHLSGSAQGRRLRTEDYSVGWVCALPIELAAATEMLDEEHPSLPQDGNDTNLYTLGRIFEHNVILACLPAGQMGTSSAAAVATQMKSKFSSIRFSLMVGIGGGVPSAQSDIRLGDVVISQPHMQHGGVIQYDFGKTGATGIFTRTGFLNTPPTVLLNALAKFRSNRYRGKSNLSVHLAGISHLSEFVSSNAEPDILFKSTYNHMEGPTCNSCSKDECVERTPRSSQDSVVHYGTIASGNQVMKDGVTRDKLSSELGGVLCFEMEAAGLMNSFPCLVIRGICDYADSHKNKRWQPYAAATAAACAKEILAVIPATEVAKTCTVNEAIEKQRDPVFLVPYTRNAEFVGRSSILEKLKEHLGPRGLEAMTTQPRAALFGLGGIGKTQIAIEYAYWVHKEFPNLSIFWIHASDQDRFHQSFYQVAESCQIPGYDNPKADTVRLVRTWLERKDQHPWLMIIDNADDSEMFFDSSEVKCNQPESTNLSTLKPKLGQYIPECSHGSVLITTRNKQAGIKLTKNRGVIEVVEMDEAESSQLIYKRLDNDKLDSGQVSLLTARLENLPLALVQAAAFIQENSLTVGKYLELLNESDNTLVELLSQPFEELGRDSTIPNAVTTTWMISFKQIRERHPLASDILSLLSYFDRQEIPKSFVLHYEKQRRNQEDSQQNEMANGSIEVEKALGILKAFSIVKESKASETFNMHRLIQLVMRKWLNTRGKSRIWADEALLVVSDLYPLGSYENWTICGEYLPHAYAVLSHEGSSSTKVDLAKASLLHCTASFMHDQGQWNKAEELGLQVVEMRKRVLGTEHTDTLASMNNLALTYWKQGRLKEAEDVDLQVAEARLRVLGVEHPETLTTIQNLALTYQDQGRWKESEDLLVQVVETGLRLLGAENPITLAAMANLALTYQALGRWNEAEDLILQVLETRKRVLGVEHPDTLHAIDNLAWMYLKQGQWKEAEDLLVQVVGKRNRVLGAEHPNTLYSMDSLASMYYYQDRWKEAEDLFVRVTETRKRVVGAEHPDTLSSMNNLAHTFYLQGRSEEAIQLMKGVVKSFEAILGPDHPNTVEASRSLYSWADKTS